MITGAAQGIGFGTARYLLDKGWCVAIIDGDRQAGQAEDVAELIRFLMQQALSPAKTLSSTVA